MSDRAHILHLFTSQPNVSPFDVNMALDSGFQHLMPYTGLGLEDITTCTQDAIFSRGPKGVRRTHIFIGGRDAILAADMLDRARDAMVPPFEVSVFADPSGAYTTAAAMIAAVERQLHHCHGAALPGAAVTVLGLGPVGAVAAVLAARAGAHVTLASPSGLARAQVMAARLVQRFGVTLSAVDASPAHRAAAVHEAEVLLATARAGVEVVDARMLAAAGRLRVAADINAVPPAGINGIGAMDNGAPLGGGIIGIGPLAIGNLKYQTQQQLFRRMLDAGRPVYLDFNDALEAARSHAGS